MLSLPVKKTDWRNHKWPIPPTATSFKVVMGWSIQSNQIKSIGIVYWHRKKKKSISARHHRWSLEKNKPAKTQHIFLNYKFVTIRGSDVNNTKPIHYIHSCYCGPTQCHQLCLSSSVLLQPPRSLLFYGKIKPYFAFHCCRQDGFPYYLSGYVSIY